MGAEAIGPSVADGSEPAAVVAMPVAAGVVTVLVALRRGRGDRRPAGAAAGAAPPARARATARRAPQPLLTSGSTITNSRNNRPEEPARARGDPDHRADDERGTGPRPSAAAAAATARRAAPRAPPSARRRLGGKGEQVGPHRLELTLCLSLRRPRSAAPLSSSYIEPAGGIVLPDLLRGLLPLLIGDAQLGRSLAPAVWATLRGRQPGWRSARGVCR